MRYEPSAVGEKLAAELGERFSGVILRPADAGYGVARRVWNAAIDRHPFAIAICKDAEDAALAVRIAAEHNVPVTVRGGGHNVAGRSIADNALLLDLSQMREVVINGKSNTAMVQGGALWHDVDVATAKHGLATTGGLVSTTGVSGFTLGGGTGWLMRRYGLAIDNLLSAGVVLADGRVVRASKEEHPDLFWGLRGASDTFGVVANLEFQLYPLRQVLAGVVVYPAAAAREVLKVFRDFTAQAPDEFCGMAVLTNAPKLPFLEASWYGRPVIVLAVCWSGDIGTGEQVIAPLRRISTPLTDHIGPMPYVQWQHLQDAGAPAGRYYYWKTASYPTLSDATIETLCEAVNELPSSLTEIHVQHLGGAVARVPARDTAFAQRNAGYFINLIGMTPWQDELETLRARVRRLHQELRPGALNSLLPNFTDQDDGGVTNLFEERDARRIKELRQRYDPAGLFPTRPADH